MHNGMSTGLMATLSRMVVTPTAGLTLWFARLLPKHARKARASERKGWR